MTRRLLAIGMISIAMLSTGCARKALSLSPKATAFGSALVESSGGKQIAAIGSILPQPVVVQVNDEQGNAVTGASVQFSGPPGVTFDPASGISDSSGRSEEHTSELQSLTNLVCRLLLEKKKKE